MAPVEAPPAAELLADFCNTIDLETGPEELDSPTALVGWLREHAVLAGDAAATEATEADLALARRLREALRDAVDGGEAADGAGVPAYDDLTAQLPLQVTLGPSPALRPAVDGVRGALAQLVAYAAEAAADGSWARLKACSRTTCRWVFYDTSRNRSRHWCSMTGCGNREKTRNYRERCRERDAAGESVGGG
jgi:predicted RNA-binding Zn ribbon-like protein